MRTIVMMMAMIKLVNIIITIKMRTTLEDTMAVVDDSKLVTAFFKMLCTILE